MLFISVCGVGGKCVVRKGSGNSLKSGKAYITDCNCFFMGLGELILKLLGPWSIEGFAKRVEKKGLSEVTIKYWSKQISRFGEKWVVKGVDYSSGDVNFRRWEDVLERGVSKSMYDSWIVKRDKEVIGKRGLDYKEVFNEGKELVVS